MGKLHFLDIPNNHYKKGNTLNKIYIWQNRGFFMGRLPGISRRRLDSAALGAGIGRPFHVLESESNGWQECRLMKENLTRSYSMNALIECLNLSPTWLVRLFKDKVGAPICATNIQIARA